MPLEKGKVMNILQSNEPMQCGVSPSSNTLDLEDIGLCEVCKAKLLSAFRNVFYAVNQEPKATYESCTMGNNGQSTRNQEEANISSSCQQTYEEKTSKEI
jgi:hypothetical protein